MKNNFLLLLFILLATFSTAQDHDNTAQKAAMEKLAFLEGNWSGEANMMVRGQGNQQINQTEKVKFQLGGTILVIEGIGKSMEDESKVVHHAFAVISFNEKTEKYSFKSWLENGLSGEYEAYFNDAGNFIWTMQSPNGGTIRYKIKLDENGQWIENGEWSSDGNQGFEFFSMTLKKDV